MSLRNIFAALSAAALLAFPTLAAAELRVGYVDYQRVLMEVEDGKAAKARLQKWLEGKQKEINGEQEALRKEKEALDKQASAMKEEERNQKASELQKKVMELAQKYDRSQQEAVERERKEMEPIMLKIEQVIASIAKRDDLGMVFEKRDSGLVYALSQYDLTNEVIRAYNSSGAAKPKPKDAPTK